MLRLIFLVSLTGFIDAVLGDTNHTLQPRIIGGHEINITDAPHQVSIHLEGFEGPLCGGSIVCPFFVLTAAHCFDTFDPAKLNPQDMTVRAGSSHPDEDGYLRHVVDYFKHPRYQESGIPFNFDAALLKVENPFEYGPGVRNIEMTTVRAPAGTPVTVSGWGQTEISISDSISPVLEQLRLTIVSSQECQNNVFPNTITSTMICAKAEEGIESPCHGDSGGPLVSEDGILVGIVSWGNNQCSQSIGIYTDVASIRDWVVEKWHKLI